MSLTQTKDTVAGATRTPFTQQSERRLNDNPNRDWNADKDRVEKKPERVSLIKLDDLLTSPCIGYRKIAGYIIPPETRSEPFLLDLAPHYNEVLKPIPLYKREGRLFLDSKHAWLVSLFLKLISDSNQEKMKGVRAVEEIIRRKTREEIRDALLVLRSAYMNESDKQLAGRMNAVLDCRCARKIWVSFA